MDRVALEALARRGEQATGPDRELDCLIWCNVNGIVPTWQGHCLVAGIEGVIGSIDPGEHNRWFVCNRADQGAGGIEAYTASLDAAVTLVPEGWWTDILGASGEWPVVKFGPHTEPTTDFHVQAKTAPLALTAAALRAAALARSVGETTTALPSSGDTA